MDASSSDDELPSERHARRSEAFADKPAPAPRLPTKTLKGDLEKAVTRRVPSEARRRELDAAAPSADETAAESDAASSAAEDEQPQPPHPALRPNLAEIKSNLAALGTAVLANPVAGFKADLLSQMFELASSASAKVRRLGLLSLLAVFKDVIPDYKIRLATDKEEQGQVSKEVRQTRKFERALLDAYGRYLGVLERALTDAPWEKAGGDAGVARTAASCIAALAESKPEFNHSEQVLRTVVMRMSSPDELTSKCMCECAANVMRADATFATALGILKVMGKAFEHKGSLAPLAVASLLHLELSGDLNDVRAQAQAVKAKKHRKDKRRRVGPDIAKALEDAEASQADRHLQYARQTEVLREVFTLYLRIVKRFADGDGRVGEPLASVALRGIGKVIPLLNPEFVRALMQVLLQLGQRDVGMDVALEVVSTALSALNMPVQHLLAFDVSVFAAVLFDKLLKVSPAGTHIAAVVRCVQQMFLKSRDMEATLVAKFVERLLCVAAGQMVRGDQQPHSRNVRPCQAPHGALALIAAARQLMARYPLAAEVALGAPKARLVEELPCGPPIPVVAEESLQLAQHAYQWTLLASRHYHPAVQKLSKAGLVGAALGPGERPLELLKEFDPMGDGPVFNPPVANVWKGAKSKGKSDKAAGKATAGAKRMKDS